MSAILKSSPAQTIGVLCVALAVGWIIYQSQEPPESAVAAEHPRTPSRERPRLDRQSLPPDAHRQPTDQLRAWAAAMTDQELAQMINRAWAELPSEDKDPDPSTKTLLCALFREWGRRDPDAAFPTLEKLIEDWIKKSEQEYEIWDAPAEPLFHAIWAGYSESDPAGAWERLGEEDSVWLFMPGESPATSAVLDWIFAQLLAGSPDLAAESAERGHRFDDVAMRVLLANMDDPEERLSHYRRWVEQAGKEENNMFSSALEQAVIPSALVGIAMRNPEQAWQLLPKSSNVDLFSGVNLFMFEWMSQQPEQAIQFFERELGGSDHKGLRYDLGMRLLSTHPEVAVEWIIRAIPEDLDPFDLPRLRMYAPQWPVVEGMKPGIPIEELQERWRKALDDQSAPPAIREMFNPLLKATD
jgi:hypothetical protein